MKSVLKRPSGHGATKRKSQKRAPTALHGMIARVPKKVETAFSFMKTFVDTAFALKTSPIPWTDSWC